MKIALAHDFLTVYGGAERVLKAFHELYPEAPIYTAVADPELVQKHFPQADVRTSWLQHSWRKKVNVVFLLTMPRAMESFDFSGYDVVLSSSGAFAHGIITGPDTYHLCYCHSPMRYAWDWHAEFLEEKGMSKGWLRPLATNQAMSGLRLWDAVSANRVDRWIANSQTVQARIKQFYRQDSQLINPPVETDYFDPAKLEEPTSRGDHMFSISRISTAKRIDHMIAACKKAGVPLRIAGAGDDAWFKAYAAKLQADVVFLGPISEEEKRHELASAKAFLFPAEDDFGIAPVEAMAMGTPVIAFGKGGATETVVEGETGHFYYEATADGLAKGIEEFLKLPPLDEAIIRARAEQFSRHTFDQKIRQAVEAHG
jgi:glycosyltransferase involved in cell wall biosynthesis